MTSSLQHTTRSLLMYEQVSDEQLLMTLALTGTATALIQYIPLVWAPQRGRGTHGLMRAGCGVVAAASSRMLGSVCVLSTVWLGARAAWRTWDEINNDECRTMDESTPEDCLGDPGTQVPFFVVPQMLSMRSTEQVRGRQLQQEEEKEGEKDEEDTCLAPAMARGRARESRIADDGVADGPPGTVSLSERVARALGSFVHRPHKKGASAIAHGNRNRDVDGHGTGSESRALPGVPANKVAESAELAPSGSAVVPTTTARLLSPASPPWSLSLLATWSRLTNSLRLSSLLSSPWSLCVALAALATSLMAYRFNCDIRNLRWVFRSVLRQLLGRLLVRSPAASRAGASDERHDDGIEGID